jgi:effector-binding domain-containing protein
MTSDEVRIETRRAQPMVSIRSVVAISDLGRTHGEKFAAIADHLRRHGAEPVGPPFVRYHTFGEHETDVEVGVPLGSPPAAAEGELRPGRLPGGTMLVAWHDGPDDRLGEAYARIASALEANGYARAGAAWEVYHWLDPLGGDDPDPRNRRIELVQPVAGTANDA